MIDEKKIKALVFDFDGVIVDSYEYNYECQKQKFKNLSREDHKKFFDGNIHVIRNDLLSKGELVENKEVDFAGILRECLLKDSIEEKTLETLFKLQKKYHLFIITSHREEILNEFFEKNKLSNLFTQVLGKETHIKKDEKFKMLFNDYNFSCSECVFITDTLGDIKEAKNVNVSSIAVDFGFHERERLEKGNPEIIISSFEELLDYLPL